MTELQHLKFERRPSPVLPEHRPLYKIAQLVLVLSLASRAGKSSLARLHLFNWAFKSADRGKRLSQAVRTKSLSVTAWGFDPALAIALRYAAAERLVTVSGSGYQLTDLGQIFAKSIVETRQVLEPEKALLTDVGKGITEKMVDTVAKGWGL
jgi:hypothetical protein